MFSHNEYFVSSERRKVAKIYQILENDLKLKQQQIYTIKKRPRSSHLLKNIVQRNEY